MKQIGTCILVVLALSACSAKEWNNISNGINEIGNEGAKAVHSKG